MELFVLIAFSVGIAGLYYIDHIKKKAAASPHDEQQNVWMSQEKKPNQDDI